MVAITDDTAAERAELPAMARWLTAIRRNPTIAAGAVLLAVLVSLAILAPWLTVDPLKQATINRLRPPSERFWFGTDQFGRDIFARTLHGARVSLIVGLTVAAISGVIGLALGIVCGYFRRIDGIVDTFLDFLPNPWDISADDESSISEDFLETRKRIPPDIFFKLFGVPVFPVII